MCLNVPKTIQNKYIHKNILEYRTYLQTQIFTCFLLGTMEINNAKKTIRYNMEDRQKYNE